MAEKIRQDPEADSLDVHCQTCSRNLTNVEGVVLGGESVYCQGYEGDVEGRCIDQAPGGTPSFVKYIDQGWPSLARKAIEEGHLVNYGHLEREAVL